MEIKKNHAKELTNPFNMWSMPRGFIFVDSEGIRAYDGLGIELPKSFIDKLKNSISDDEYNQAIYEYEESRKHQNYDNILPKRKEKPSGWIYAVRFGDKIKIGRSKNIENRLKTYKRTYHDYKEIGRFYVKNYVKEEDVVLRRFGGEAQKNEFLDYTPELEKRVISFFSNKASEAQNGEA